MGKGVKSIGNFVSDPLGTGAAADVARASQNVALAQQREARAAYNETKNIINPATVSGLAALDRDIANQERNLSRQEQLISQIDPTILEASQQALKLLRGEESSALSPLKRQREQQRQRLLNSLREQLGPGAETSTAGIQALNRFDAESDTLFGNAQQNALTNLGNTAGQFNAVRPDMFRDIMGLSQLSQGKTDLAYKQAGALSNARLGLQQTAGAQYTGDLLNAQNRQAINNMFLETAIKGGMAYATGGLSAMAPGGGTPKTTP